MLIYHLHELGTLNSLDLMEGNYSFIGFGSGANIALYYSQMMLNDTSSTLKSLILINPYIYIDNVMRKSIDFAIEGIRNIEHNLLFLDNLLHSKEDSISLFSTKSKPKWDWPLVSKE